MNIINQRISLPKHLENFSHNFNIFIEHFPKIYLAAEIINDLMDQIFIQEFVHDNRVSWKSAISAMLFGVHMSWIQGFINNASSLGDIGLMATRKAVEYVCYIAKIYKNDDKAKLWLEKKKDINTAKKFSRQFQIPQSYFNEKYSHLKPLLVYYDYSCEYGVHANLRSLASKWIETDEFNRTVMSFQDACERTVRTSVMSVQIGSLIVDSLLSVLQNDIIYSAEFQKRISIKKGIIADAKIEAFEFLRENEDFEAIKSIHEDDMYGIGELFQELKVNCNIKEPSNEDEIT